MEIFNNIIKIICTGICAYGSYLIVMGGVQFASSLKDKSGPGVQSGLLEIVGGVIVVALAVYFTQIKM